MLKNASWAKLPVASPYQVAQFSRGILEVTMVGNPLLNLVLKM
jgi:hypothetical protein